MSRSCLDAEAYLELPPQIRLVFLVMVAIGYFSWLSKKHVSTLAEGTPYQVGVRVSASRDMGLNEGGVMIRLISTQKLAIPSNLRGAELMEARSQLIRKVFNQLDKDHMDILDIFYDPDIVFEDPLGRIEGIEGMRSYYGNMYENVTEIRFAFQKEVIQDDSHFAVWTMYLKASSLNKGREIAVTGSSIIEFGTSGKVTYHRDFFDMGAFIYEHIPVLRWAIGNIKKRLSHQPG